MNSNKQEVLEKFKGKVLAFTLYQNGPGPYRVSDFTDFSKLEYVLDEVNTGEADITKDGIAFLKDYYGFDELASKLFNDDFYGYKSVKEVKRFLEEMRPFVTANFISNINKAHDLSHKLKKDKKEVEKIKKEVERLVKTSDKLGSYYNKLEDKERVTFVVRVYELAHSFPGDHVNFLDNLERDKDRTYKKISRKELEQFSQKVFDHFKPKDSFPIDESEKKALAMEDNKKRHLSKMMKIMKWLMLIMSLLGIVSYIMVYIKYSYIMFGIPVSILGVIGSVYLFQKKKAGIIIGIIWAGLQVVILRINNVLIDFAQGFSFPLGTDLNFDNFFISINVNVVALAILIVFLQNRKKLYF